MKAYFLVSLRRILNDVLGTEVRRLQGETPRPPLPCTPPGAFAAYTSPHNAQAAKVVALLASEAQQIAARQSHSGVRPSQGGARPSQGSRGGAAPALALTTDPATAPLAGHFILYLNDVVFDSAPDLCTELEAALRDRRRVLCVHEQRDGFGAVPFSQIIKRTPPALLRLGLYKELAVPLYAGDEYQRAALLFVLAQLSDGATGGGREAVGGRRSLLGWSRALAQKARRYVSVGRGRRAGHEDAPALLEMGDSSSVVSAHAHWSTASAKA